MFEQILFSTRLMLASLFLVTVSGNAWGSFESGVYFPLVSGTTWAYRANGSFNFSTTVLAGTTTINGVATTAVQESVGLTNYYTNDSNGIRLHRQVDVSNGVTATFIPPVLLANASTDVAQTANSSGTASTNLGDFFYSASFTITGFETIAVPMGRFEVARVDGTLVIAGLPSTLTIYLAQNAGIVKSIETAAGSTDTFELVSRTIAIACPTVSLQAAVDIGLPGEIITVTGACSENILIRNEKQRITVDGNGVAAIVGASPSSPALNIRGKGILIQGMTITGGGDGVVVNRGSNAVINTCIIQNTGGHGLVVNQLAFAVLTGNQIQNNPGIGILVSENSTARIGFNSDSDVFPSPNNIFSNGLGIAVMNGASARIISNTVGFNGGNGVYVARDSQTDIASNNIFSNGENGIEVRENSFVQLGEEAGSSIYQSPNGGSGNAGVGIKCVAGGGAGGRQGSLTGMAGETSFEASCINDLSS